MEKKGADGAKGAEMLDRYGISRVIEPKGTMPVTAWKLDNSREISKREARLRLERVHIERDSFQQLCSECGFDKAKVMVRIMDIAERRGKLHNPFTNSGGMFHGVLEEMGERYKQHTSCRVGDEVIVCTSSTGLPLHLDQIKEIDYNYGDILVDGYVILFEASAVFPRPKGLSINYTLAALDESSTFETINEKVEKGMTVLIIGKDIITTMFYAGSLKHSLENQVRILAVMDADQGSLGIASEEEARQLLSCYVDKLIITDITKPLDAYGEVFRYEKKLVDVTINTEDLSGSETLTVLMTVPGGSIFFTSLENGYSTSVLIAESMGKELVAYSLDQYTDRYFDYTVNSLRRMKAELEKVNGFYEKAGDSRSLTEKKAREIMLKKSEKIDDFVFRSPVTKTIIDDVLNIANYDCNVIIQGETGSGKEKILGIIHKNSSRSGNPCVRINCATIQENLAESEFFGYEAGAFTGAQAAGKKGYFELANNGILFLDEIGQLSLNMQSKLLRVLQENEFFRIGGTKQLSVNVRVICANNIPLKKLVEEGTFREDLYYRLNICTIEVPPLRERKEDIYVLADAFVAGYNKKYGVEKVFSPAALARLHKYDWPGNVRELENAVHRMVISSRGNIINEEDADMVINERLYDDTVFDIKKYMKGKESFSFGEIIAEQEKRLIAYALKKEGSTRKAAAFLNMTQAQLSRKKLKYDL